MKRDILDTVGEILFLAMIPAAIWALMALGL